MRVTQKKTRPMFRSGDDRLSTPYAPTISRGNKEHHQETTYLAADGRRLSTPTPLHKAQKNTGGPVKPLTHLNLLTFVL